MFPPNLTVAAVAGVQVRFSGSNIQFIGSGDTTVWDFSTGMSSTAAFLVRNDSTATNRVRFSNLKMIGNRVAAPTATQVLIICSATVGVVDRCVIDHMTLTNASGSAISLANAATNEL